MRARSVTTALAARLRACGDVVDPRAAERTRSDLAETASREGWSGTLDEAWPALAPVFAASPYLASLATRDAARLSRTLGTAPATRRDEIVAAARDTSGTPDAVGARLRALKSEIHLLVALADLGGVWALDEVTGALSDFADAAVQTALATAVRQEEARGRVSAAASERLRGLFVLALGKHGARELNYSSDIDVSLFYAASAPGFPGADADAARAALRTVQSMTRLLAERTAQGYVFRVDLRLRPDPASTPVAVEVDAALAYYESVGQNWERAALIKARPIAGDIAAAEAFLRALRPFLWRRTLDYAAVADVQAVLRQIQVRDALRRRTAAGADLKLGPGGIREIEFFTQTQQLILGGRDATLRGRGTCEALGALARAGHLASATTTTLVEAYTRLRGWEHRIQMLADEQMHRLPVAEEARARIGALAGATSLGAFDAQVEATLRQVSTLCAALFADDEPLSSPFGPLVFTGVEDDPETLATLAAMGFADGVAVARTVRGWHHGRIAAMRTPRGRELFTRLAPRLLEAAVATGAADTAFARFATFFEHLASGVQIQSLLLAEPALLALLVRVLALSPRLATVLAQRPAALDALVEPGFFAPIVDTDARDALASALNSALASGSELETTMNAVRRAQAEAAFRIGVHLLTGVSDAAAVGRAFADLADACLAALAPAALREVERLGGGFAGEVAVIALGKFGGREMTATSDLDLMTIFRAEAGAQSAIKKWAPETVYARFTQRLVAALSAPTAEGGLYTVDLQLRPSGTAGPVSTSLAAFARYYAEDAQTWEFLALTRARVAWASSTGFGEEVANAIETALRRPRDRATAAADVRAMRALMARERPASGFWDMKLSRGGLVDVEFAVQHLQLAAAAGGGPLRTHTGEAIASLAGAPGLLPTDLHGLETGWRTQQALSQVLRLALAPGADPSSEPEALRDLLARAARAESFAALSERLKRVRVDVESAAAAALG